MTPPVKVKTRQKGSFFAESTVSTDIKSVTHGLFDFNIRIKLKVVDTVPTLYSTKILFFFFQTRLCRDTFLYYTLML